MRKHIDMRKLAVSILACVLLGSLDSIFTAPSIGTWYASLAKPAFTPPNWLFAPVWTALFVLMGIALYLVWEKYPSAKSKFAMQVFAVQFTLNVLWSALFFGLRSPLYGFVEIVVFWLAIAATIALFYRVSRLAAYLLVPYIVWVTIAAALNYSVMVLNWT